MLVNIRSRMYVGRILKKQKFEIHNIPKILLSFYNFQIKYDRIFFTNKNLKISFKRLFSFRSSQYEYKRISTIHKCILKKTISKYHFRSLSNKNIYTDRITIAYNTILNRSHHNTRQNIAKQTDIRIREVAV